MTLRVAALILALPSLLLAQEPGNVRDFVRQRYIHGVPYDAASRFGPESEGVLLEMLNTPSERKWWANVAQVLGATGDKRAADGLIQFVRSGEGPIGPDEYNGKTTAIASLGLLLNRTMDQSTFAFLRNGLGPNAWNDAVKWQSPFADGPAERNEQLTIAAIRGLGLSGRPEAVAALSALRQGGLTPFNATRRGSVTASIDEALLTNAAIRARGLKAFLARPQ